MRLASRLRAEGPHERARAFALLTVSVIVWGGSWRAMEIAGELAGATTTAALRSTVATLVLLVVLPLVGAKLPRRDVWPWAALTGLLIVTVAVDGQAEAVLRAGVATGAVLGTTAPFFILALGRLLFGNRFSAIGLAGMITGFAGVAIVITSQLGGDGPTDLTLGVVFAFVSAAAFALGTLIVKRLTERDPELDLVGLVTAQHIVGSAALIVLALIVDGTGGTSWGSARLWGAIAWVGPGASALGFVAFLGAVRLLDAARAATWIFLVPGGCSADRGRTGRRAGRRDHRRNGAHDRRRRARQRRTRGSRAGDRRHFRAARRPRRGR